MNSELLRECLKKEVSYRTSRASGPGGQHVNKTESRVVLCWNPEHSACLDEQQKILIRERLASRLTDQGILCLASERHRSQYRNREEVTERFLGLVLRAMARKKKRYPTRPTLLSKERRIRNKKIRGELKRSRRNRPDL